MECLLVRQGPTPARVIRLRSVDLQRFCSLIAQVQTGCSTRLSYKPTKNAQGPRFLGWSGGLVGACQALYRADQPPVSVPAATTSVVPVCVTMESIAPLRSDDLRGRMQKNLSPRDRSRTCTSLGRIQELFRQATRGCAGPGSNRGPLRQDRSALPTELPARAPGRNRTRTVPGRSRPPFR